MREWRERTGIQNKNPWFNTTFKCLCHLSATLLIHLFSLSTNLCQTPILCQALCGAGDSEGSKEWFLLILRVTPKAEELPGPGEPETEEKGQKSGDSRGDERSEAQRSCETCPNSCGPSGSRASDMSSWPPHHSAVLP